MVIWHYDIKIEPELPKKANRGPMRGRLIIQSRMIRVIYDDCLLKNLVQSEPELLVGITEPFLHLSPIPVHIVLRNKF